MSNNCIPGITINGQTLIASNVKVAENATNETIITELINAFGESRLLEMIGNPESFNYSIETIKDISNIKGNASLNDIVNLLVTRRREHSPRLKQIVDTIHMINNAGMTPTILLQDQQIELNNTPVKAVNVRQDDSTKADVIVISSTNPAVIGNTLLEYFYTKSIGAD